MAILDVRNLTVDLMSEDGTVYAVQDISFTVQVGEFFGIVGESGSGKSVLVQAILGLIPNARVTGEAWFDGRDLLTLPARDLRAIRGSDISMIFQDPLSSLHPQYTIGSQITELIHTHRTVPRVEAHRMTVNLLEKVGIPDPESKFTAYPHQFSGGMRQRVMIAMALILHPRLIIADEPTTALDSTVQAQVLDLLQEMKDEFNVTVLMITHDLAVLARVADRVAVMYAGRKLELGPRQSLFTHPAHPYTSGLLRSSPANHAPGIDLVPIAGRPPSLLEIPRGCVFAPRCPLVHERCSSAPPVRRYSDGLEVACWIDETWSSKASNHPEPLASEVVQLVNPKTLTQDSEPVVVGTGIELVFRNRRTSTRVLDGVTIALTRGETLGLVGESGCGKTTLARVLAGLIKPTAGSVSIAGQATANMDRKAWKIARRNIQIVFQDPFGSLNPRRRVGSIIGDPFRIHRIGTRTERKLKVRELMEVVGLNAEHYNRFPTQFSGGQRQRIGIARALALNPAVIIFDEPVSALDVSIQAQILNLMFSLQRKFDLSYIFISHDLSVVHHMCDRIAVMECGQIVEIAPTTQIFQAPQQEFTKRLLAASQMKIPKTAPLERTLLPPVNASVSIGEGVGINTGSAVTAGGGAKETGLLP